MEEEHHKRSNDNIRKELNIKDGNDQLCFTKEIIDHAHYIYLNKMTNIGSYRKIKRHQLCYILIIYACEELNLPYDTEYIRNCFNLTPQQCQRAYIDFSSLQTGYTTINKKLNYEHYIDLYSQKLAINADLSCLIKHIEDKCDALKRNDNPQYYAAALLALYFKINNVLLNPPLEEILHLDHQEMERCYRRVEFVHINSQDTINSRMKYIKVNI